jgi:hypothetical protein
MHQSITKYIGYVLEKNIVFGKELADPQLLFTFIRL